MKEEKKEIEGKLIQSEVRERKKKYRKERKEEKTERLKDGKTQEERMGE